MLNGYVQNLVKEIQEDLKIFTEEESIIKPTPENVLGFSLYKEQEDWVDFCYSGKLEGKKDVVIRMLLGSRKYGKTDIITIYSVILMLSNNPKLTFIIASRKQDRLKEIIFSIGTIMKELGFKGVFNKESIRLSGNISKYPNISVANSSTASIRGYHVDILICDDLVIAEDERSEVERQKTKSFYAETLNVADRIIILGQPVHEQDLYAFIDETVKKGKNKKIEIKRSFHGSIPELDKDLEELCENSSKRNVYKNYKGIFIAEGLYPFSDIKVEEFEFKGATMACIDPAFEGEDTIGLTIGIKADEKYKILATKIEGNIFKEAERIIKLLEHFNVYKCFVESNDNGGVLREFKKLNNSSGVIFVGYKETLNKEIKIRSRVGSAKNKIILHSQSDIKEITFWNEGVKHDDCIDSVAGLLNFLNGNKEKVKVLHG